MFLDLRGKTQQAQYLCYPGAGDALLTGDVCLVDSLAGFQESLPLDGLAE